MVLKNKKALMLAEGMRVFHKASSKNQKERGLYKV